MSKYSNNVKKMLAVAIFMNLSLFTPIETVYFCYKGVPMEIISILNLIVPISCAVLEIPTGVIGDCIGRKNTLSISVGSFALSSFILIFANNIPMYFLVYIIEGIGWSFFSGNTDAIIVEEVKGTSFNLGAQFAFFYAGFSIAPIIAGLVNSTLIKSTNGDVFRTLIIITFIFKLCGFICTFFINIKSKIISNSSEAKKLFKSCLKKVILEKQSIYIIIYEATGRLQFYIPVLTQSMLNKNGFNIALFGVLYTGTTVITVVAQYLSNKILEKYNSEFVFKNSTLILVFSIVLMLTNNNILIILGFSLISIIGPIRNLPLTLLKNQLIDDKTRSTYLSIISFLVLSLNFIMLSLVGFIFASSRIGGLLLLMIMVMVGGFISIKNLIRKPQAEMLEIDASNELK